VNLHSADARVSLVKMDPGVPSIDLASRGQSEDCGCSKKILVPLGDGMREVCPIHEPALVQSVDMDR